RAERHLQRAWEYSCPMSKAKFFAEPGHLPQPVFVGKHLVIHRKVDRLVLLEQRLAIRLRSQPDKNPFEVIGLVGDHDLESLSCRDRKIASMQLGGKALVDPALKDLGKCQDFLHSNRHTAMVAVERLVASKNADRGQA